MDCLAWGVHYRRVGNTKTNYMIVTQDPGRQLHSQSSPGERNGKFSQNGKLGYHVLT